jgi:uncharacterized membrane protein YkvA (DUF1232 family)
MAGRRIDPARYADPSMLGRIAEQLRLSWRLITDERVPVTLKVLLPALVAIYVVSPIDLVPDFLLGLGQLDDIGVVLAALALFVHLAPRQVVDEHRGVMDGGKADSPAAANVVADEWWRAGDQAGAAKAKTIDVDYVVDGRRSS